MEKKMVFFDLDGTVLDENKQIHPEVKRAVRKLASAGYYTAIATGRAPFMFDKVRKDLGIHTYVSFNGQFVVFEGETLYSNPLDPEALESLDQIARSYGHPIVFLDSVRMRTNKEDDPGIRKALTDLRADVPPADPDYYKTHDVYQGLLFCREEEEGIYTKGASPFQFIRWHELSLDVLPPIGSKALGIEKILRQIGIKRENTYAFGDGLNDIEMLKFVGTGVAMGNAKPATRQAADLVCGDVADGGLVSGLQAAGLLP